MKLKKFGFLKHHRKIKIEGTDLPGIVNKCIDNGIRLKNLVYKSSLESDVNISDDDYKRLKKLAGHSYRMTTIKEKGITPFFRSMKNSIIVLAGAFLIGALIFYQSLFVAEIRVDGYESITERALRTTMAEAGLYEGARKPDDYSAIKASLYEEHKDITWVSIYEEGRLIKVNIAEAGKTETAEVEDESPVNIAAAKSGIIERIMPLQGNAKVQKGDYVNKGDLLISGRFKYQSSDYSKGDGFFYMYSHAKGQVMAKVPRQVSFYLQKSKHEKLYTGKKILGIYVKLGDMYFDTAGIMNRFESSVRAEKELIDIVKPLPFSIRIVKINEAKIEEKDLSEKKIKAVTEAAVRQYECDELKADEKILDYTVEYKDCGNLIKADILMEVLEDIGREEEIKVNKAEK